MKRTGLLGVCAWSRTEKLISGYFLIQFIFLFFCKLCFQVLSVYILLNLYMCFGLTINIKVSLITQD